MPTTEEAQEEFRSTPETDSRSIYVGHVALSATPEQIAEFFAPCGAVERVTILTGPTGKPKGYAYLLFHNKESVDEAQQFNGKEFLGQQIKVFCYLLLSSTMALSYLLCCSVGI